MTLPRYAGDPNQLVVVGHRDRHPGRRSDRHRPAGQGGGRHDRRPARRTGSWSTRPRPGSRSRSGPPVDPATGRVTVKAGGRTYNARLDDTGRAVIELRPFGSTGNKTVRVGYDGDSLTRAANDTLTLQGRQEEVTAGWGPVHRAPTVPSARQRMLPPPPPPTLGDIHMSLSRKMPALVAGAGARQQRARGHHRDHGVGQPGRHRPRHQRGLRRRRQRRRHLQRRLRRALQPDRRRPISVAGWSVQYRSAGGTASAAAYHAHRLGARPATHYLSR